VGTGWHDRDDQVDVISIVLQGLGSEYAVVCSGPKGMKADQFITAIRAAAAALIYGAGGDMEAVGASPISPDGGFDFDTGDQKPN
jgi:hypothetical protein